MLDLTKAQRIVDELGHAYHRATEVMGEAVYRLKSGLTSAYLNSTWEAQEKAWQKYDEAHQLLARFPRGRA